MKEEGGGRWCEEEEVGGEEGKEGVVAISWDQRCVTCADEGARAGCEEVRGVEVRGGGEGVREGGGGGERGVV